MDYRDSSVDCAIVSVDALHTGYLSSADFFKNTFFQIIPSKHYQSVKRFGSRSGPTKCRA